MTAKHEMIAVIKSVIRASCTAEDHDKPYEDCLEEFHDHVNFKLVLLMDCAVRNAHVCSKLEAWGIQAGCLDSLRVSWPVLLGH